MPSKRTGPPTPALHKGEACSTCKARKVKCDALKPGCSACRRTARFEGRDPDTVTCCYKVASTTSRSRERRSKGKGSAAGSPRSSRHSSEESHHHLSSSETESPRQEASETFSSSSPIIPTALPSAPSYFPLDFSTSSAVASTSALPFYAPTPAPPPPMQHVPSYFPTYVDTTASTSHMAAPVFVASPTSYDAPSWPATFDFGNPLWSASSDTLLGSPESLYSTYSDFSHHSDSSSPATPPSQGYDDPLFAFGAPQLDETLSLPLFPLPQAPSTLDGWDKVKQPFASPAPWNLGASEQAPWNVFA